MCMSKKKGLKMSFKTIIYTSDWAKLTLGRDFHSDGTAMANAWSPSVALDFTDGIARSKVLEPLRL